MGGYGIGSFGEGFVGGYATGERINAMQAETKRQDAENARRQTEFDRRQGDIQQLRALGDQLSQMNAAWLGDQSGQPAQLGVQTEPVGPPQADGTPAAAPQAQAPTSKPMTYMDALKDSQQHLQRMAPILTKIYAIADPKKAAEYSAALADAKTQYAVAEEAAVGRLLLSNPNSSESRDALIKFYGRINDGRNIIPDSYEVLGNGSIKFRTADEQGGDVRPEVIEPARIRAMMMRNLSADKVATVLVAENRDAETKRFHDAQIDNMERDDKRREREFGVRMTDAREERAARREDRAAMREDRKAAAEAKVRDEVARPIQSFFMGDPKTFPDRSPEERAQAASLISDSMSLVEMNDLGKSSTAGTRAASVIAAIAAGKFDDIVTSKSDPSMVWAIVGGQRFALPRDAFVVRQAAAARSKAGAK